jgi:hypothetical protein
VEACVAALAAWALTQPDEGRAVAVSSGRRSLQNRAA